jgi:hypothetical protein
MSQHFGAETKEENLRDGDNLQDGGKGPFPNI